MLFLILALSSCGYYFEKIGRDEDLALQRSGAAGGFAEIKAAIFEPYCVRCHGQYVNYENVSGELAMILATVNSDRMPKSGGPLPPLLKEQLRRWIAAGAPPEPGAAAPEPIALSPDYRSLAIHIFSPRCVVCHNPEGQGKFLDLSQRSSIFNERARLFNFDDPAQSYLLTVIQDEAEPMPPPSSNLRRLNEQEIETLTEWIRLGLP